MRGPRAIPLVALLLFAVGWQLSAETEAEAAARFERAITLFQQGDGDEAFVELRRITNSSGAVRLHADAYFWKGRIRLAQERGSEAAFYFERVARDYPGHPRVSEARYHRARASVVAGDYERALVLFEEFLDSYPESPFAGNAYFWSGESLMALGRREEAARLYEAVVRDYPRSFRAEAAEYRLSLIELSEREQQLQRLLRWSHEEHLRTIEASRRSQEAYEDALAAYQAATEGRISADAQEVAALRAEIARLVTELGDARASLAELALLRDGREFVEGELAQRLRLAQIKEDALRVKERLLLELDHARGEAP